MNNIFVSVIIPVYNVEKYLRQCLDSMINQTFRDIEIITVNDCSTDNCREIIEEYQQKDSRISLIDLPQNNGLGNARNEGLKAAKGKYITFVDSDDWITNDYIEILHANISEQSLDVVSADFYTYDNATKQIKLHKHPDFVYNADFLTRKLKQKILTCRMIWNTCTKMYDRDFLAKNDIHFKINKMEDILFFYEIVLKSGKIKFIAKSLYYYRIARPNSIMQNKTTRFYSCIKLLQEIKALLKSQNLFEQYIQSFYSYGYMLIAAELEVSQLQDAELKTALSLLKKDIFNDASVKIRVYDKIPYRIRTHIFYFCFKHKINYRTLGKILRKMFLFCSNMLHYLKQCTPPAALFNQNKYIFVESLGFLYVSPIDYLKKITTLRKDKKTLLQQTCINKTGISCRSKKIIIVIDNSVPEYDIHAGARTLFQYLNLYADMDFDVKFIPRDFIRREPYATELEKAGIEVLHGKWCKTNYVKWIIQNAEKINFVMLNRPRSIENLWLFKKYTNAKIIYYGMDMYFVREYQKYLFNNDKKSLRASQYYKKLETYLYDNSDIVLTVSKKEEKDIKDLTGHKNVMNIPCFIYKETPCVKYSFENRRNMLFVGGQQHTPNKDAVIWFAQKIYPLIASGNKNIKLYVAGKYNDDFIKEYSSDGIIFTGVITDLQLQQKYLTSRLAVVPLTYGAGVKGKTIEAMYYGLPVVSTYYGIEGLDESVRGFIATANNERDFAQRVLETYDNKRLLENMSEKSHKYTEEHCTYDAARQIMSEILK